MVQIILAKFPQNIEDNCPVIFILFGNTPNYMLLNIELASKTNSVIVLSDSVSKRAITIISSNSKNNYVIYEPLNDYLNLSKKFQDIYRHLCKDRTRQRKLHELRCIQRLFIQNIKKKILYYFPLPSHNSN